MFYDLVGPVETSVRIKMLIIEVIVVALICGFVGIGYIIRRKRK